MVAISYQKGVIMCQKNEKMNGRYFSDFVRLNFREIVHESINPNSRLFVKDGDPGQNPKAIKEIERLVGSRLA